MNSLDPKVLKGIKRLRSDFELYAKTCVKIRTKNGEQKPLILNPIQKRLLETIEAQYAATGKIRVITLKARQAGLSTLVSAYLYWKLSQQKSKKGLVIAHKSDSTRALFDMYQRIHSSMTPHPLLKPETRYSGRRELVFDALDTGIVVATAGGEGIARGETLTHAHLSELAFWQPSTAAENLNALLQAIPNTKDTVVFVESTANGMSGPFYEMWQGAVAGTNGFIPFFSAWFETAEYREPVNDGFDERTLEEQELVDRFGLDDEQLQFRRTKIALNGREAFFQEYPSTPDEAFRSSGQPVFNPIIVHKMLGAAPAGPKKLMRVSPIDGCLEEHPMGELSVYREHEPGEVYTIGADVALGSTRDGDYSVAQILDGSKRQVAIWRGHVDPEHFATVLDAIGRHYNNARIAVETNSFGLLTAVSLRNLAYPNIYTEIQETGLNGEEDTIKMGFRTTASSKRLIIGRLISALNEAEITLNDKTTLREMLTYVVTQSGGMEAEPGCYDDTVMALAIANHVHEGRWVPIEVPDDCYYHAI